MHPDGKRVEDLQAQEPSASALSSGASNGAGCPRAALFDLDDTLAETFEVPSKEMLQAILHLLDLMPIAIITGRDFPWMESSFLPEMVSSPHIDRFYVLPEGAAQCRQWDGKQWKELYGWALGDDERVRIKAAIAQSVEETGVLRDFPVFGERYVDKKAMIAFAALGLEVPRDLKYSWDPGNVRRALLRDAIAAKLPEYDVLMGGATSTDVTKKGVNKSHGVRWLSQQLQIPAADMLYVGDALYPGGNDYVVVETGIRTRPTTGPKETLVIINELLVACQG